MLEKTRYIFDTLTVEGERERKRKRENMELIWVGLKGYIYSGKHLLDTRLLVSYLYIVG
jgi:hypothetical protein